MEPLSLSLLTCNYDTRAMTLKMIRSFRKTYTGDIGEVYVMDTSPIPGELKKFSTGLYIEELPGFAHGEAVNYALNLIEEDYLLLVDTDVIFYKDVYPIIQKFVQGDVTLGGNVSGSTREKSLHWRVDPWFCFLNLKYLRENHIEFFDEAQTRQSRKGDTKIYNVGSTLYEDVVASGLKIGNFNGEGNYFKHYEGMSWRSKKYDQSKGDTDIDFGGTHNHAAYYHYGLEIQKQYDEETREI